jgi:hypothetical protein
MELTEETQVGIVDVKVPLLDKLFNGVVENIGNGRGAEKPRIRD